MSLTTINMPHMAANGLSENWLFRHCGDAHWQALCGSLGVSSTGLHDNRNGRLYPTFVAISARYSAPLSAVEENDVFDTSVSLAHFGQSFFHSVVSFAGVRARFELEMLTAFAARETAARNDLRKATPASTLRNNSRALAEMPELLNRAKAMRRGELGANDLVAHRFNLAERGAWEPLDYEPSPYQDFNGANLLYFASYPTIVDSLERRIVHRDGLGFNARDWAIATSTIARDVFYYRNLDIGESLRARLRAFVREGEVVFLRTTLSTVKREDPVADVFTAKQLLTPPNES